MSSRASLDYLVGMQSFIACCFTSKDSSRLMHHFLIFAFVLLAGTLGKRERRATQRRGKSLLAYVKGVGPYLIYRGRSLGTVRCYELTLRSPSAFLCPIGPLVLAFLV